MNSTHDTGRDILQSNPTESEKEEVRTTFQLSSSQFQTIPLVKGFTPLTFIIQDADNFKISIRVDQTALSSMGIGTS